VFEEAGDTGGHGRLKHPGRLGLLIGDKKVFADVKVRFALPFPLGGGIGILGGVDHGLRSDLIEIQAHHGSGPLGEVELLGIRREHLLVRVAATGLGEVEREDPIGLGRVELDRPDEIGDSGDVEALVEASEAAIVEGEWIVGIELDRFAEVFDCQGGSLLR
jgi:hypothetical protein